MLQAYRTESSQMNSLQGLKYYGPHRRILIHNKKLRRTEKELCCRGRLCTDPKDERLSRQAI